MAKSKENKFDNLFEELVAEKASIRVKTDPLREKMKELRIKEEALREQRREIADDIRSIEEKAGLVDLSKQISALALAKGGKRLGTPA